MLSGVYSVQFGSEALKGGLVIVTAEKMHGGDPENIIAGYIHVDGNKVHGEFEVTNHTSSKPVAFAGNDILTIKFEGETNDIGFQASGKCIENQALDLKFTAEKIRDIV